MCGSTELIKQDGLFVCKFCGCKYTVEEAKKMMVEGTVDVQGTVKVDNSAFVQKYLANARRALGKEDWEEVEKYYNMVEQNVPNNMEAVFFSSFGKAMLLLRIVSISKENKNSVYSTSQSQLSMNILKKAQKIKNMFFVKSAMRSRKCTVLLLSTAQYRINLFRQTATILFNWKTLFAQLF